jgi:hypothetical protein
MSRVGKMPITVPQGVDVQIAADQITVKGATARWCVPPTPWSTSRTMLVARLRLPMTRPKPMR